MLLNSWSCERGGRGTLGIAQILSFEKKERLLCNDKVGANDPTPF